MIAYALADDREAMDRVRGRYGAAMAETRHASAFSLVAEQAVRAGDARLADMVSTLADIEGVDAFMAGFAQRFDGPRDPES
jgi:hypothetical protein